MPNFCVCFISPLTTPGWAPFVLADVVWHARQGGDVGHGHVPGLEQRLLGKSTHAPWSEAAVVTPPTASQ